MRGFFQGVCVVFPGACIGCDEIRSMSGPYASYWNAFLLNIMSREVTCLIGVAPTGNEPESVSAL